MKHVQLFFLLISMIFTALLCNGCLPGTILFDGFDERLEQVAESSHRWTGVAVSQEGRIFVNFPRWSDDLPVSVAEITSGGRLKPYPDLEWNSWDGARRPGTRFICVQSVYLDGNNHLWVLDAANPKFAGVVPNGPKLVEIDVTMNTVIRTVRFDAEAAPAGSYLNDVRVDTGRGVAYISDSGLGAIIVADLHTGRNRRVLGHHYSAKAENMIVVVEGREWRLPDGSLPRVHLDGIALDMAGEYLYYHALTARNLYRIKTEWLRDERLTWAALTPKVEFVFQGGPVDGIVFGPDGGLYMAAIEDNAVRRYLPGGGVRTVVKDARLSWPDSLAVGPDGFMYITSSRIHLGDDSTGTYRLFRFRIANQP